LLQESKAEYNAKDILDHFTQTGERRPEINQKTNQNPDAHRERSSATQTERAKLGIEDQISCAISKV